MPDLFVSSDTLDFGDVKCGECCIITIQLFNNNQVPCSWTSRPSSAAKKKVRISARSFNGVKLIHRNFLIYPTYDTFFMILLKLIINFIFSDQKERMIPMYRRKQVAKMEKEAPQEFQLIPSSGHLLPGQRKNVQVKFMPLEEVILI